MRELEYSEWLTWLASVGDGLGDGAPMAKPTPTIYHKVDGVFVSSHPESESDTCTLCATTPPEEQE